MLKVCLDDHEALQVLTLAAEDFARDTSAECVGHAFTSEQLTAPRRKDGEGGHRNESVLASVPEE